MSHNYNYQYQHQHQHQHHHESHQTYEQKIANKTIDQIPDPIHYNPNYSYRNKPYRHLNHQQTQHSNKIGTFHVRLVEANGLERKYWSLLGLGVVRHLGLSNAHGEVSSFASLRLGYRFRTDGDGDGLSGNYRGSGYNNSHENDHENLAYAHGNNNWQHGNLATTTTTTSSVASRNSSFDSTTSSNNSNNSSNSNNNNNSNNIPQNNNNNKTKKKNTIYYTNNKTYKSSTIPSNSKPNWPSVQTNTNKSSFDIPLHKGSMPEDGMEIILSIVLREEKSAVDSLGGGGGNDGLLGVGEINLTGLVLRDLMIDSHDNDNNNNNNSSSDDTTRIQTRSNTDQDSTKGNNHNENNNKQFVDVYDEWINLTNPQDQQSVKSENNNTVSDASKQNNNYDHQNEDKHKHNHNHHDGGQVRLIISYEPCGLKPQKGDIIAFESFARRPNIISKCPTIIPPFHPLKIKDMKGEYILAMYDMIPGNSGGIGIGSRSGPNTTTATNMYTDNNISSSLSSSTTTSFSSTKQHQQQNQQRQHPTKTKYGYIRIHRNTIFVIERTNLLDTAFDLTLKPTDMILSTPMGQNVSNVAQPYVEAASDLLGPVFLSSKLLLEASKVGGGALAIGVKSAVVSVVENSDPEKRRKVKRSTY